MTNHNNSNNNENNNGIINHDMAALRSYITAEDHDPFSNLHKSTLMVDLTHSNLAQKHIEIRFDKHTRLDEVRDVIYRKTGTPPCSQVLQMKMSHSSGGAILHEILPDDTQSNERMLGYYGLEHGVTIHCLDIDPHSASRNGQYEDVSLVEKYRMSEEEYDRRKGTLRDWGRQQKKMDPKFSLAGHARRHQQKVEANRRNRLGVDLHNDNDNDNGNDSDLHQAIGREEPLNDKESVKDVEIGMRCEVQPGGRRGSVQFVGEISHLGTGGYWIGVQFDEPVAVGIGNADGCIKGRRYFEAVPGYAGFVRGKNLQVGDFPERDIMDDLDDDSEDEL